MGANDASDASDAYAAGRGLPALPALPIVQPGIRYFRVLSCDCHEAWLAEGLAGVGGWRLGGARVHWLFIAKLAERRDPTIQNRCMQDSGDRYLVG